MVEIIRFIILLLLLLLLFLLLQLFLPLLPLLLILPLHVLHSLVLLISHSNECRHFSLATDLGLMHTLSDRELGRVNDIQRLSLILDHCLHNLIQLFVMCLFHAMKCHRFSYRANFPLRNEDILELRYQ